MFSALPPKQGLYDPQFEHDACGVGFVVDIAGRKSNEHRAESASSPHQPAASRRERLRSEYGRRRRHSDSDSARVPEGRVQEIGLRSAGAGQLRRRDGLPAARSVTRSAGAKRSSKLRSRARDRTLLGWRDVPTNNSPIGDSARKPSNRSSSRSSSSGIRTSRSIDEFRKKALSDPEAR